MGPGQWWVLAVLCWSSLAQVGAPGLAGEACVALQDEELASHNVMLPTNITAKPLNTDWRLDFTLLDTSKKILVCVSLQVKGNKIQLALFEGKCDENIKDFQLWKLEYVKISEWTMIHVAVNASSVIMEADKSGPTVLLSPTLSLPKDALLQVTQKYSVDLALECRVSCPASRVSEAPSNMLTTVKELLKPKERFFFKPGKEFNRLNIEIKCETALGIEVFVGSIDITRTTIEELSPLNQWHKIFLEYDNDNKDYVIIIDYITAQEVSSGIITCNIFKNYFVRTEGETFFSFACDPSSGEKTQAAPSQSLTTSITSPVMSTLMVTLIVCISLMVSIYLILRSFGWRYKYDKNKRLSCIKTEERKPPTTDANRRRPTPPAADQSS